MLVVGVRYGEVVVLGESRVGDGVHPVRVREWHRLSLVDESIIAPSSREAECLAGSGIVGGDGNAVGSLEVNAVVAGVGHRIDSIVEGSLCHGGNIAVGVQQFHLRLVGIELGGEVGGEVHGHLVALLAFLRRDDDHTV